MSDAVPATAGAAAPPPTVQVRVPPRSWRSELRAIKIVWRRELIRFRSDRLRIVTSLVQPLLFLFVLGSGLQQLSSASTHGVDLKTFIYPGILCIAVMFTAMFSAASIVWDREFGFLREMMVAPVRRSSIVIGKVFGGATVASLQGLILLALAWTVHVPYSLGLIFGVFGLQLLLAFSITAFGVMIAARIKQIQSFMGVMQMIVTPMFFISGALFPSGDLPGWLAVLNRLDPITYAVSPMRTLVFANLHLSSEATQALNPPITWFGWEVPLALQVFMIFALGMVMLGIAIAGVLVEAFVPSYLHRLRDDQYVDAEAVGVTEAVLDVGRHDPVAQRLDETHIVFTRDGVRLYPIVCRYAWPSELDLMARIAGLRLVDRWGGWNHEPFTAASRLHVSVYGH